MPYTIACRHHKDGRHDRHPRQWDTWDDVARELAVFVENLVTRLSSPLNEPERAHIRMLTAQITRAGIAVLPGLTTYRVIDVTDAPARDPARSDAPGRIDWPTVGRLARRAQRLTIDLNTTASVAATDGQDIERSVRRRALLQRHPGSLQVAGGTCSTVDRHRQVGCPVHGRCNPKSHELIRPEDPSKAMEYLGFASLLHCRLDIATPSQRRTHD